MLLRLKSYWYVRESRARGIHEGHYIAHEINIDVPEVETPATIVTQFVDNIRDNTDLAPTFFDGVRAQEVMAAVSLSAQESRWVSLPLESA